ncbi:MAG: hypothetical protein R2877_08480 [Bdellovibrionota bacterium]
MVGAVKHRYSLWQRMISSICLITFVVTTVGISGNANAQLAQPVSSPSSSSSSTFPSFLFGGSKAVENPSAETTRVLGQLIPMMDQAAKYYQSAQDDGERALIENLFPLSEEAYAGSPAPRAFVKMGYAAQAKAFLNDGASYILARQIAGDATRIYMNQVLYNWMRLRRLVMGDTPLMPVHASVQGPAKNVVIPQIASMAKYTSRDWASEMAWINQDIESINQICKSAKGELDTLHAGLSKYKQLVQGFDFNLQDHPDLVALMYPSGFDANLVSSGGYEGRFKDRMESVKNQAAIDVGVHRFMISQTLIGELYDADTEVTQVMGSVDGYACASQGRSDLHPLTSQSTSALMASVNQMEKLYRETVEQLIENQSEDPDEIILRYVYENPTSIQMAVLSNPNAQASS